MACVRTILNILWLLFAGIWLALGHVFPASCCAARSSGIPLGVASFTMVPISLLPLGRETVPTTGAYAYP
jgi:uncharacterized membrane protein YccF (DUF307 family)